MKWIALPFTASAAVAAGAAFAQSATTLAVANSSTYGRYLTDAENRAVYLLESDPKGRSICYEACAQAWPPVPAAPGAPQAAGAAVRKELIGSLERHDGSRQITYNGHPLYYYVQDRGRGKATGHDVHDRWGGWYLVTPQGTKLERNSAALSAGAGGGNVERTFLTLDENRDGAVTRQEAGGMPALAERFKDADMDASRDISRYEFDSFISR